MKKIGKRSLIALLLCMALLASCLTGCGGNPDSESAGSADTSAAGSSADGPIQVVVAGTPAYSPYTYVGENGEETGFDIEVVRAIDEISPEIECEFTYTSWDTLMPGLDAGRFDIVCNQLGRNAQREEMYTFGNLPFACTVSALIVNAKHSDWTGWESLSGIVACSTGSSFTTKMEAYLEKNPGAFTITYTESGFDQVLEDVANSRADATMEDPNVARIKAKENGLEDSIHIIDLLDKVSNVYFMFAKTDKGEELAKIIDKYLPQLYYDGTLSELANEYLGSDNCIKALPANGFYTQATLEEFRSAQ